MKKLLLPVGLFVFLFVATYLTLCFRLPGWRIKLAADGVTYWMASIQHMALLKSMISLAVGLVTAAISVAAGEWRRSRES